VAFSRLERKAQIKMRVGGKTLGRSKELTCFHISAIIEI
jgi:hypothetical protein